MIKLTRISAGSYEYKWGRYTFTAHRNTERDTTWYGQWITTTNIGTFQVSYSDPMPTLARCREGIEYMITHPEEYELVKDEPAALAVEKKSAPMSNTNVKFTKAQIARLQRCVDHFNYSKDTTIKCELKTPTQFDNSFRVVFLAEHLNYTVITLNPDTAPERVQAWYKLFSDFAASMVSDKPPAITNPNYPYSAPETTVEQVAAPAVEKKAAKTRPSTYTAEQLSALLPKLEDNLYHCEHLLSAREYYEFVYSILRLKQRLGMPTNRNHKFMPNEQEAAISLDARQVKTESDYRSIWRKLIKQHGRQYVFIKISNFYFSSSDFNSGRDWVCVISEEQRLKGEPLKDSNLVALIESADWEWEYATKAHDSVTISIEPSEMARLVRITKRAEHEIKFALETYARADARVGEFAERD